MAHAVPSQVRQSILRLFPDIEAEPNVIRRLFAASNHKFD